MVQKAVYASEVKEEGVYWIKPGNKDWLLVDVSFSEDRKSFDALELSTWESITFGEGSDNSLDTTDFSFLGPVKAPVDVCMPSPRKSITVLAPPLVRASDGRVVPPSAVGTPNRGAVRTEVRFQN